MPVLPGSDAPAFHVRAVVFLQFLCTHFTLYDSLSCGHTYCKDCLETMSVLYLKARYNLACPSCRTIQGRFTPIPNYFIQQSVDNMLKVKGIPNPTCKPLQWPRAFRSGPMSFPFPRRSGTYPVAVSTAVPAPFPLPIFSIDDD